MGPPGAARDWGTTEERGGSVVRANEDEDGRSVVADVVGPPAVGGRLPRPLLDNARGVPGSASSTGEGRNGWPPSPGAVMAVGVVVRGMTTCLTVATAHRRCR